MANFIKRFFDRLPIPLFPFDLYKHLVQQTAPTTAQVLVLVGTLPVVNQQCLAFLITLLKRVESLKQMNKMTSYNLSVILGPSLIRPQVFTPADVTHVKVVNAYVQFLLDNCEYVRHRANMQAL